MKDRNGQDHPERPTKRSSGREAWEWIKTLATAIVLAFIIHRYLFAIFMVDGSSMVPTLHDRERLIVNKLAYHLHSPQYNDIVVFAYPADPSKDFIKRVIGLPGDKIEIRDFKVFRNGHMLDEPFIAEPTRPDLANQVYTVPPGTIFALGDNRNYSHDSRYPDVGYVPDANIVGRADFVWWPLQQMRKP